MKSYYRLLRHALRAGINVFDTALTYGGGSSERAIGAAIADACNCGEAARDEIVVVTKAGYVPHGPANGTSFPGGTHSIAPKFLRWAVESSRSNLSLATLDVFLLHNIEEQLVGVGPRAFATRVLAAFEELERLTQDGAIRRYGIATWAGLGTPPRAPRHVDLAKLVAWAEQVAGDRHHFGAIEAPFNAARTDIATMKDQHGPRGPSTVLEYAAARGIIVLSSSTLMGGQLALPGALAGGPLSRGTSAERAIAFACSEPGVGSALVGMRTKPHLMRGLRAARAAAPTLSLSGGSSRRGGA
jgi:aryl-alcohol dehydrogenase-like predicted oxidoreductase